MVSESESQEFNKLCKWSDGTVCWIEDLAEYLIFMSDDFEIIWVPNHELQDLGLM